MQSFEHLQSNVFDQRLTLWIPHWHIHLEMFDGGVVLGVRYMYVWTSATVETLRYDSLWDDQGMWWAQGTSWGVGVTWELEVTSP